MVLATASVACMEREGSVPTGESLAGLVAQQAGGDVALDSAPEIDWLTDSNVVALVGVVTTPILDAARLELQNWVNDTVQRSARRVLADLKAIQWTVDSAAGAAGIPSQRPALADVLEPRYRARLDAIAGLYGKPLERRWVETTVQSLQDLSNDLESFAAATRSPELRGALSLHALPRVRVQLAEVRALQRTLTVADSTRQAAREARERAQNRRRPRG